MNDLIAITQQGDILVVDSRLIATKLGVGHADWYRNILLKYQTETGQAFGHLRFESDTVRNSVGAVNTVKFALLTEDQATFLMTLSRNTPEVVACKITLVKSFSEAKRMLEHQSHAPFWYQRLVLFRSQNKVPPGYFSIFQETIELVGDLETAGYVIPDSAIPDISIGLCWAKHLRNEGIEPNEIAVKYPHQYPDGRKVDANSYSEDMLPKFRRWFRETYKPMKLPAYLGNKDKSSLPALSKMLDIPIALLKGN